jgi:hypothetical protein
MVCPTCGDIVSGSYCFRCRNLSATDYTGPKQTLPEAKEALKYAIIGIFCFGFILGPLAIVKGTSQRKSIAMDPRYEGEGNGVRRADNRRHRIVSCSLLYFIGLFYWRHRTRYNSERLS